MWAKNEDGNMLIEKNNGVKSGRNFSNINEEKCQRRGTFSLSAFLPQCLIA